MPDALNYVSRFCDLILAFDDASEDASLAILCSHPLVKVVVCNHDWDPTPQGRRLAEGQQRQHLLDIARGIAGDGWVYCFDPDERIVGDVREAIKKTTCDALRVPLFDAYLTHGDCKPYAGGELLNSRQWFGPERRDIVMLWKLSSDIHFGVCREPRRAEHADVALGLMCQHYGKALSVARWEAKCRLYSDHFPRAYNHWASRRGRAIHTTSDFGGKLVRWSDLEQRV